MKYVLKQFHRQSIVRTPSGHILYIQFFLYTFIVQNVDSGAGIGARLQSLLGLVDGQHEGKILRRFYHLIIDQSE